MLDYNDTPHEIFLQIWYDFYRNYPVEYVRNMVKLGYDGVLIQKKGLYHIIAFNPGKLKIINTYDIANKKEYKNLSEIFVKTMKRLSGV